MSLLVQTEARGLPGATMERVEFQRAGEGRPLDDVVIVARSADGTKAVLEIQVKRSINFSPSDEVFRSVVGQMVEAANKIEFWTSRHELAVATARSSAKIDRAYQEVLNQSKQIGDAKTFFARLGRKGQLNDDMRQFVATFKEHLRHFNYPDDEEGVWALLRRFQILVFDFAATGSQSEELAKERCVRALPPDQSDRASGLWSVLVEISLDIASDGGDRDRDALAKDLKLKGYTLASISPASTVRAVLAEMSGNAIADIQDRVAGISLSRNVYREAVDTALERYSYVEIRGDAGVGKSGILKHVAQHVAVASPTLVLSPNRTIEKGWTAFQSVLGYQGSAREFLSDLASDGGAYLFIDNLDFFEPGERATVSDLIRAAADVPGFSVISTARRSFEDEGPNWLPTESLSCASPIEVDELSDSGIEELCQQMPSLRALFDDDSPARDVSRNLFRLSRLVKSGHVESGLFTEIQIAGAWWRDADGVATNLKRECSRLLSALGEASLAGHGSLDTRPFPGEAVDALVTSGTLKELGIDHVAFEHDAFREWAIAHLLAADPVRIDELPLDRPATPALARGIELAARMALEHDEDGAQWATLLNRVSNDSSHGSWRRNVLVAPARAENASDLMGRVSADLLENHARLLGELIRVVLAVDSVSALQRLQEFGLPKEHIPTDLRAPRGASWLHIIGWVLSLGADLPKAARPAVTELYSAWSMAHVGLDSITPVINTWFYYWLTEIEQSRELVLPVGHRETEDVQLSPEQLRDLETSLRSGFLLFSHRNPELAKSYLQALAARRIHDGVARDILRFSGTLAQAAPQELARLTARELIGSQGEEHEFDRERRNGPFEMVDHEFYPASPNQGPFLALLSHAPDHGLWLIRLLVDHAIEFYSRGNDHGENKFEIPLERGVRFFPWRESYSWSRESPGHNGLTSALMALEEWCHRRVEQGEDIEAVIGDVIGAPNTPAAGLLVVVDLLLSHVSSSIGAAIPYLACPELLCIDRERLALESMRGLNYFGDTGHQKSGSDDRESNQERPSRQHSLDELLSILGASGPTDLRDRLRKLLETAAARLGTPSESATLGDPAFMAVHALNLINPDNWRDVDLSEAGMEPRMAKEYVPPESEARHMAPLQAEHQSKAADDHIQFSLSVLLDDASRSTPEFVDAAIDWAKRAQEVEPGGDSDAEWIREQAIYASAMVTMRDGTEAVRDQCIEWADQVFTRALDTDEDPVHRIREGIRYNPFAIAFAGMIYALQNNADKDRVYALLSVAARENPAAAHGLGPALETLVGIDCRLPRSILRCAFAACVKPPRVRNLSDDEAELRHTDYRRVVEKAVEREIDWLFQSGSEPEWPEFPEETVRTRRRLRIPGGPSEARPSPDAAPPTRRVDRQAASLWLNAVARSADADNYGWTSDLLRQYAESTAVANGSKLDADEEVRNAPSEWNRAYYEMFARNLNRLMLHEIEDLLRATIVELPDEAFFDAVPDFLRVVDAVFFNEPGLNSEVATRIREIIADRLKISRGWQRLARSNSASIEIHIAPAIATVFFSDHQIGQQPKCYLYEKGVDRAELFLPILNELVLDCPSQFVAMATLSLLEVSPRGSLLPLLVSGATCWLDAHHQDVDYWIQYGIGSRICAWLSRLYSEEPALFGVSDPLRPAIDRILSAMVQFGLAEASQLEKAIESNSG